jgi:hypothetical protein
VPNTAHILQFTLCELWFRPYIRYIQLRIFRLQYSSVGICSAIVDITWILCALYRKLSAKYSAHPPVYAMWPAVPAIYRILIAPHIQTSIFIWTYLGCYWRYLDNSTRVCLHTMRQIQSISSRFRCVNCRPGHIQGICSSAYLAFNILLNLPLLLLEICRYMDARYTANVEPNTAHMLPFTLCELWSRLYTKYLQLRIFGLQYSAAGIISAVVDITSFQCAWYCKHGAKYSAHPPVYAMWTVVPAIYKEFTAPHI